MNKNFEETKEETYSLFQEKCGGLLRSFLRKKEKMVCSLCSESCTETEKVHRALKELIEEMTIEAMKGCSDRADIFICALCPCLSAAHLFKSFSRGKTAKRLTKEMETNIDRLLVIIRGRNEREN